jgi:hypothetical protein
MIVEAVESFTRPLITADRCDKCGAEAKSVARNQLLAELFFCEHHATEYRDTLMESGFYLDTETLEARN